MVETMGGTSPAFEFVRDALLEHVTTYQIRHWQRHMVQNFLKIAKEKM